MQRQMDTNMEPKTISFLQPDNYFTKVQPPAESFMELDYGPCTDDDLSSFWPSRPGREIFSNYDLFCNSNDKNHQTRQPWGFNCESEGRTTLWDEINSTVEVPMEEYRIVTPDNFEEPDEVCDRGESLLVTMPGNLLLGWELQHSVEERNSSITYKSPLNASITLSNSSFFSPNYGSQVSPLPCSSLPSSPSSPNNDFERRYIKEKEDIAARWKHIPLTLPHDTTSQVGSIFRFPESDQWCMSKMFREYHPSLTDAFNSSEMVFNFGSEYLTGQRCITTYHGPQFEQVAARIKKESRTFLDGAKYGGISSEIENVALQDWSSFYFQIFHNQEKASWPLVRDNPVWEEVAEEIH